MKLPFEKKSISAAAASLALFALAFGSGAIATGLLSTQHQEQAAAVEDVFPGAIALDEDALTAKAAVVYDPTDGRILFSKNPDMQLPLASLTKLMTAQVVLSQESPDTLVKISQGDVAIGSDAADEGFQVGNVFHLGDLIKIGLTASSNSAMAAAAESLGDGYLQQMNKTAETLGLSQMYFLNPTGLDVNNDTSGAYGSAYDVARLAAAFYQSHPEYFELSSQPSVSISKESGTITAATTAAPLQNIPGFVGAKTGYTDLAGGNLVAVFDIEVGHPVVAVVLGSTEDGRFDDIRTLINAARGVTQ